MKLFRFFSKQSSRFAYAGLIVNVGKAFVRCFSGMAHNECALNIGGSVKGASPSSVYLPPSHKQ